MRKQEQKGFTIIELVVVIVILGILAAVAFPKFQDLSGDARTAVLQGAKAAVQSAAVLSYAKNQGAAVSLATVQSQVNLDAAISFDGGSTCSNVTLNHSGGGSVSFSIADYCT